MKRRTEIILEFEQVVAVRSGKTSTLGWCALCGRRVEMLTPEMAALITRNATRTIYRWVEAGHIHYEESPGGILRVCLNSLPDE